MVNNRSRADDVKGQLAGLIKQCPQVHTTPIVWGRGTPIKSVWLQIQRFLHDRASIPNQNGIYRAFCPPSIDWLVAGLIRLSDEES